MGARRPQKYWKTYYFVQHHFFEDKTVRRRFWDQLRPTKAPRGAKMTPKRDPRSTPKRPKTDIKIELNFDAKTKRVGQGSVRRLWGAPPPWRRPRSPGEGGQATRERPPGTHARGKRSKEVYNYTSIQSIQYTLYSIQCTWVQYTVCKGYSIQYTGYKGIRVYSIQGTKGSGKRA